MKKPEIIPPNPESVELIRTILAQNGTILAMNADIIATLAMPIMFIPTQESE
jgi:hypothetical protein